MLERGAAVARKQNSRLKKKFTFDDFELVLLSLPTVIWYAIFSYLPIAGIVIAFKEWRLHPGTNIFQSIIMNEWVGFDNFQFLLNSPKTALFIRNTLLYNIVFIVLGIVIPVSLAIMIANLHSKKMAKVTQTAMFLPHFMSWVVGSYFLFAFLSPNNGIINGLLESMGMSTINWYSSQALEQWPFIIVIMNIWKGTGYGMVIYLASITGIDHTYYEAAVIDGASKWQQITKITLPLLKNIIIIMFIMAVGRIFNSDFGLFYQVPRNSFELEPVTLTIDVYVYNALRTLGQYNLAQAGAVFQSVFGCITILIANAIVKKIDKESAFF